MAVINRHFLRLEHITWFKGGLTSYHNQTFSILMVKNQMGDRVLTFFLLILISLSKVKSIAGPIRYIQNVGGCRILQEQSWERAKKEKILRKEVRMRIVDFGWPSGGGGYLPAPWSTIRAKIRGYNLKECWVSNIKTRIICYLWAFQNRANTFCPLPVTLPE